MFSPQNDREAYQAFSDLMEKYDMSADTAAIAFLDAFEHNYGPENDDETADEEYHVAVKSLQDFVAEQLDEEEE